MRNRTIIEKKSKSWKSNWKSKSITEELENRICILEDCSENCASDISTISAEYAALKTDVQTCKEIVTQQQFELNSLHEHSLKLKSRSMRDNKPE